MSALKGVAKKLAVALAVAIAAVAVTYAPDKNDVSRTAYANGNGIEIKAMGSEDSPVTLYEFSSLTCGHCGNFHKTTLRELKKDFIDEGKLYYVYNDFPLNKPALDASLISRCMPEDRFWGFLDLLFTQQKQWAFSGGDYLKSLKQNARLAGMSGAEVDSCIDDESATQALAANMQKFAEKYEIDSTPTFVLKKGDAEEKLVGNQPVEVFREKINRLLE